MKALFTLMAALLLMSCAEKTKPADPKPKAQAPANHYARNLQSMVRIITYDVYGQKIADGFGAYVAPDVVVTPLSWFKGAYTAKVNTMESRATHSVFGYVACDIDRNVVALRISKRAEAVNPIDTAALADGESLYSLDTKNNRTLKTSFVCRGGEINTALPNGTPLFDAKGDMRGLAVNDSLVVPSAHLQHISAQCTEGHRNIYELRLKTNKKYPSHAGISGFRVRTTMGSFTLRLYNETPAYRDNFIRLVCDGFYDSLLVHRVLPNYLIQTGAADSKHAKADDVVGWQGPGYTLPMQLAEGKFHRRGAVAASKLPQDHNRSNRSDGSQFYVVAGRRFTASDLKQIEKDYGKRFTPQQIECYTTVGGAPYLDGDYTVFGEVTDGMDVVDRIAAVPLSGDRPATDIRVLSIEIVRKR